MLKFYILISLMFFLVFLVEYVYEKFFVENTDLSTPKAKAILGYDLLRRLGYAAAWLPIGLLTSWEYRETIKATYRDLFKKWR